MDDTKKKPAEAGFFFLVNPENAGDLPISPLATISGLFLSSATLPCLIPACLVSSKARSKDTDSYPAVFVEQCLLLKYAGVQCLDICSIFWHLESWPAYVDYGLMGDKIERKT